MQALPYLQLRESERPVTTEKKNYRLSLHDTPSKTGQHADGQSRSGNNVNRMEYSRDSNALFEGTSSIYFGDLAPFRTPLPSPTPSRILRRPPRTQNHSSLPTWIEPLGVWLTNKKKCNNYETFTRNVELLRRSSDMFLDPCPHVPRCSHERTLSALRRQHQRFKSEAEWKRQERHMQIIERVEQIRDIWEQWTNKTTAASVEHESRLNNFRKSRDGYNDPDDVIKQKKEERLEREKIIRLEQEKKRQEILEKRRFRLPKIIVTQHFDESRSSSAKSEPQSALPNRVDIPCGSDNDRGQESSDTESQGSKGDRLEIPELHSHIEEYFEDITQTDEQQNKSLLRENENQVEVTETDVNNSNLQEKDLCGDSENNVVLEDNGEKVLEDDVSQSEVEIEPESEVNKNVDDQKVGEQIEEKTIDNSSYEQQSKQCSDVKEKEQLTLEEMERRIVEELGRKIKVEEKESERKVEEKQSETNVKEKESETKVEEKENKEKVEEKDNGNKEENEEIQMNYLVPPVAGENGSDHGSIGDADETASLMGAFIPVALGVGNGLIPNDAMRASSVLDRHHVPSLARLNNARQGKYGGAWKPKVNDKKQYLEVDLGALTRVLQVATQGYPTAKGGKVQKKDKCWVETYTLAFSTDGSQWQLYTENGKVKVFKGNKNNNSVVINSISNPTEARFVRFIPQSWKNSIAMRVEVYGEVLELDMSRTTPPPPSPIEEEEEKERVHEVILEDEEEAEVKEFVCGEEDKEVIVEQDKWEEETVCSVVETATEIQSKVAVVSRDSQATLDIAVQGEKQSPKSKRKPKKPKQEEYEAKKKKKKKVKRVRERKVKDPIDTSLIRLDEEEEEERASTPEEEEQEEEEIERRTPSLPEIPKRPESVTRIPPAPQRTFSMFPPVKKEEPVKPVRRRAQTDDSIKNELMRQQLAEDRRKKLQAAVGKAKREVQAQSPVYDNYGESSGLDDFLAKYCIISEGQANYYRRIFKTFDEDQDGFLFPEDLLEALESVNSNLLSDSHITYIYRVMELCDCSLDSGVDLKLFSVVAAFSQRVAVLDEFAKILISKLDFRELDFKLQRAKRLFLCYVDEEKKTISLEELMLGLTAGGLTADQKEQTLKVIGRTASLDFLDFLTYIPLFIHIHDHILQDPIGTVVYRDMLTV